MNDEPNKSTENAYHDEKGKFKPGNPGGGRPKGISVLSILKEQLGSFVDGSSLTYAQEIVRQHLQDAVTGNTHVREDIIDRIDGKATQKTEVSGPEGEPLTIKVEFVGEDKSKLSTST